MTEMLAPEVAACSGLLPSDAIHGSFCIPYDATTHPVMRPAFQSPYATQTMGNTTHKGPVCIRLRMPPSHTALSQPAHRQNHTTQEDSGQHHYPLSIKCKTKREEPWLPSTMISSPSTQITATALANLGSGVCNAAGIHQGHTYASVWPMPKRGKISHKHMMRHMPIPSSTASG